jgi:hypothetical protein
MSGAIPTYVHDVCRGNNTVLPSWAVVVTHIPPFLVGSLAISYFPIDRAFQSHFDNLKTEHTKSWKFNSAWLVSTSGVLRLLFRSVWCLLFIQISL